MTTANTYIAKHPKFIDPVTDFGFKLIFKDEEITRGFLNALVKTQYPEINIASVTITDGELDDTSKNARRVVYDVRCVTDTGEDMKESDCKTDIDKWIFNLTNMPDMKTQLSFTNDIPLFMRLEQIASYSALSPKQQMQYDDSFNNYLAVLGHQEYYTNEGIRIGMEKGMEKGRAEEKIATARKMKLKGYPLDDIAEMTGLTQAEIIKL